MSDPLKETPSCELDRDNRLNHYGTEAQTPGARWRKEGKPDPHGGRYDCERAQLAGGHMTDDEVANAMYLDPNIGNLTIAKDRIRWLSRQLEKVRQ